MIRIPNRMKMQQVLLRERWGMPPFAIYSVASAVLLLVGLFVILVPSGTLAAQARGASEVERGEAAYQSTCAGCHSIEKNRIGPRHRGLVGRVAGTEPGYDYSEPLKNADFVWDEAKLDRWLSNPRAMVPGTKMAVRVSDAEKRAEIIAYLETQ